MRFLSDPELYTSTARCLASLRALPAAPPPPRAGRERFHLYWLGGPGRQGAGLPFGRKQAFALKSFLAVHDPAVTELWLWLDAEAGHAGHAHNPYLAPLLPRLKVMRFDPLHEARGTPAEGHPELWQVRPVKRSNYVRQIVLYRHGGTWVDMDTLFLRDFTQLAPFAGTSYDALEYAYQWSGQPYANSAILRLDQGGALAEALLVRAVARGDCGPRTILRYEDGASLDLLVLPAPVFDPLWLYRDGIDRTSSVPFRGFADFFAAPASAPARADFFPGAFAYHWHNLWQLPEHPRSWFAAIDREIDRQLGLAPVPPPSLAARIAAAARALWRPLPKA